MPSPISSTLIDYLRYKFNLTILIWFSTIADEKLRTIQNILVPTRILKKSLIVLIKYIFNSHAGGMAVARPYGVEIDFVRNLISGSASWFAVVILKFIFAPIFEIKIHEKKILRHQKNFIFEVRFSAWESIRNGHGTELSEYSHRQLWERNFY